MAEVAPRNFILIDNDHVDIGDGITISGIPYYEYAEHFDVRLEERVHTVKEYSDHKNYLMIHQTPKGIGNEMIPTDCNPTDDKFKAFDFTFCGHIHKRQDLTSNFTVVGSPIHRDRGDIGQKKGFLVMDLQAPDAGYVFVHLDKYPEFIHAEVALHEETVAGKDNDFLIHQQDTIFDIKSNEANLEEFSTDLEASELIKNFWAEVDGNDEKLLEVGLSFL